MNVEIAETLIEASRLGVHIPEVDVSMGCFSTYGFWNGRIGEIRHLLI